MAKIRLDREEAELLDSYEAGEWRTVEGWGDEAGRYREYARATFRKDRRVNIRISSRDLEGIQKRALEEGIPYQTLIASVLHKYLSGRLVDRREQPQLGRGRLDQVSCTTRPSNTVIATRTLWISAGSMARMSRSSTTRSASLPGVMLPRSAVSPVASAGPMV